MYYRDINGNGKSRDVHQTPKSLTLKATPKRKKSFDDEISLPSIDEIKGLDKRRKSLSVMEAPFDKRSNSFGGLSEFFQKFSFQRKKSSLAHSDLRQSESVVAANVSLI